MSQNPKPRRRLTPCHRHPDLLTATGLCAPCLHERLSLLNPTSSSAALNPPELQRCKTFSDKNRVGVSGDGFQPRRRSCEVRGRDSLFEGGNNEVELESESESGKLGLTCPVLEVNEEEEDDDESVPEGIVEVARVSDFRNNVENEFDFDLEQGKTMKEFIDLELETKIKPNNSSINRKDFKEIAGSLLGAASVFSKKLRKWRKKEGNSSKDCNRNGSGNGNVSLGELKIEDLRGRRLSYSQSEVGDFGLGRRSCDTDGRGSVVLGRASIDCGAFGRKSCDSDPRFSIDLGRESVDESKNEFVDAPRASWDGYLVGGGGKTLSHRGTGPMVSVIENAMATVYGFDDRVLGDGKVKLENVDENKDSSRKLRKGFDDRVLGDGKVKTEKGFDRCSSVKKDVVVMSENGDLGFSNGKVSPAPIGIFNGTKLLITEKELNEWRLNSLKDDSSESFETASKDLGSVSSSSVGKDEKKCRQWSKLWSFLGLLPRRKGDELTRGDATRCNDTTRDRNRATLVRSYSTSSSRASSSVVGPGGGTSNRTDSKALIKRRQDVGYSSNQIDNGLLRFYLTPLRSRRRNRLGNSKLKKSHSLARSVLKLY